MNITPWPTKTSSSMNTPSQMKLWEEILQRSPTDRALLNFHEGADAGARAHAAAIEVHQIGMPDDGVWRYLGTGIDGHGAVPSVAGTGLDDRARPRPAGKRLHAGKQGAGPANLAACQGEGCPQKR